MAARWRQGRGWIGCRGGLFCWHLGRRLTCTGCRAAGCAAHDCHARQSGSASAPRKRRRTLLRPTRQNARACLGSGADDDRVAQADLGQQLLLAHLVRAVHGADLSGQGPGEGVVRAGGGVQAEARRARQARWGGLAAATPPQGHSPKAHLLQHVNTALAQLLSHQDGGLGGLGSHGHDCGRSHGDRASASLAGAGGGGSAPWHTNPGPCHACMRCLSSLGRPALIQA